MTVENKMELPLVVNTTYGIALSGKPVLACKPIYLDRYIILLVRISHPESSQARHRDL